MTKTGIPVSEWEHMLKFIGLIIIMISGAGLGFSGSRALSEGLRAREMLLRMVILLKGEIRYGNASLIDAMTGAAVKLPGIYGSFLRKTAKELEMRGGSSPGEIFRRNAESYFREIKLPEEEKEKLYSLGEHLGYLDLTMQMKQLELFEKDVEESIEIRKRELPEQKKVYRSLGILFGFFLVVLMF